MWWAGLALNKYCSDPKPWVFPGSESKYISPWLEKWDSRFLLDLPNLTESMRMIPQFHRLLGFTVIWFWWYTCSLPLERILLEYTSAYRQPANHSHLKSLGQKLHWCHFSRHTLICWRQLRMRQDTQTCLTTSITYGLLDQFLLNGQLFSSLGPQ